MLFHNQLMVMEIFQQCFQQKTLFKNFFEAKAKAKQKQKAKHTSKAQHLIRKNVCVFVFDDVLREI
jgi:ABC-type polar amino acid transport system ATPase subunit